MADCYSDFAEVYDELMDQTPYEEWCDRIVESIEEYGISKPVRGKDASKEQLSEEDAILASERNLVVDLGCGTGTLTEMLYMRGYDMIGIDNSYEMLERAMEKREALGSEILYLNQDMRELELYSTIGTVVCVCDSINYLLEDEEVKDTVGLVHNYLYPGGLFVFDFNTDYKYREVIGDATIAENREDCSFIWENYYSEEDGINEYDLTIFVKNEDDTYRRVDEVHFQKGYEPEFMRDILSSAGFEIVKMVDSDTETEVTDESERVFVVARCIK